MSNNSNSNSNSQRLDEPEMTKNERVNKLKEHLAYATVKHETRIMQLSTLKDAHVYCVIYGVSAQQYGPLLERFIRIKFNYVKNSANECTGDCSKNGMNSEVKVSVGGSTHAKFNFVQLRPAHDCDNYILTAYHLCNDNVDDEGELYIFKISKDAIKKLIVSHGSYAHGTIKEHGIITNDSIDNNYVIKEYALRPSINDECWKAMIPYRISESEL